MHFLHQRQNILKTNKTAQPLRFPLSLTQFIELRKGIDTIPIKFHQSKTFCLRYSHSNIWRFWRFSAAKSTRKVGHPLRNNAVSQYYNISYFLYFFPFHFGEIPNMSQDVRIWWFQAKTLPRELPHTNKKKKKTFAPPTSSETIKIICALWRNHISV